MVPKVFLDTNIVIDFLEQRLFGLNDTNNIFKLVEDDEISAFVSETVITNAIYISGLEERILRLLNALNVLCIDKHSFESAMKSSFRDKEDGILYYGALNNKMDYFITRNKKDFLKYSYKELPVISATDLIKKLNK